MRFHNPSSISTISIDGKKFEVLKVQADVLSAVSNAINTCHVGSDEFLAAPHFPGVYAYLNAKAPFWETYYLFARHPDFQQEHIHAIAKTRLILLAPNATVDGLERLKLKNTYGLLLQDIQKRYVELGTDELPSIFKLYGLPADCL